MVVDGEEWMMVSRRQCGPRLMTAPKAQPKLTGGGLLDLDGVGDLLSFVYKSSTEKKVSLAVESSRDLLRGWACEWVGRSAYRRRRRRAC